jgi:hypothetical protein
MKTILGLVLAALMLPLRPRMTEIVAKNFMTHNLPPDPNISRFSVILLAAD